MKLIAQTQLILAAAVFFAFPPAAFAQAAAMGEGSLQEVSGGAAARILPLKHTEVKAGISGFVAEVSVTQVFVNPATAPIEAVYVFPLPENAAVNELTLTVADRVIKGQIKRREEARQVYEKAMAEGKTAALLDQERPNIFTQSVANIPPGHEIWVTLKYIQTLGYDHGIYTFVFPMTVGPRYIPGDKTGKAGTGWAADTGRVPDASRITPPVVKPGQRSGRDISVEVKLDAGVAVKNIRSASHEITVATLAPSRAEIGLDPEDRIANKDFLLSYEPAVREVGAAVLAHKEGKEGYLTLLVQPGADFPLSRITPKELVIALDVSGSMSGFPVETAKETALRCLEGMNPGDTFQIMSFASGNRLHFERPLKNTPENVALGRAVINGLHGGGGTEMLDALRTVLEFPKDPARLRIVLFMTDGYIGDDTQLLGFIKEHLNNSRIFPLGVGSSVNRYLLEEMAVMGRGTVQYVRQDEKAARLEQVIEKFYDRISRPVLTDLAVDWNGLDVSDASPALLPDLFSGQPVFIHARYKKSGVASVTLKGKLFGQPWKMAVKADLPENEAANAALGPLWARARITELSRAMYGKEDADLKERIVGLALAHKLVTQYTSFVAVDESTAMARGQKPLLVPVEAELPEGTRHEGFFGSGCLSGASGFARGGAYAQAKFSARAGSALGAQGMTGSGGAAFAGDGAGNKTGAAPAAWLVRLKTALKVSAASAPERGSRVAALAAELLASPSRRLLRQLLSLQDGAGAFLEPGGGKAAAADQALALLALAGARAALGAEAEAALNNSWRYLRGISPAGLSCKEAVTAALKGSGHWSSGDVQRELAALGGSLDALK
ncbi:MAG TPA: VIT domain-containing protein [Elusimicrobiales bacterium]|nr:VIT domain-containing protein [Elusimicrobiales bacterium]